MVSNSTVHEVFGRYVGAVHNSEMIQRESSQDKEFHFQNWVKARLDETGLRNESAGRNSFPDFRMVHSPEGYEVKGLAYPRRETNYDANSQVPSGSHNGRIIFYVFGRYPKEPDGNTYPVLDLVICHGSFLNADHEYVHKNRSIKGFGSYGDVMIRDRKMYVVPTPFGLVSGVAHTQTLILPESFPAGVNLRDVGRLTRREADRLVVGYTFDLRNNTLTPETIPNPTAGREHVFRAWRLDGGPEEPVSMRDPAMVGTEGVENGA